LLRILLLKRLSWWCLARELLGVSHVVADFTDVRELSFSLTGTMKEAIT